MKQGSAKSIKACTKTHLYEQAKAHSNFALGVLCLALALVVSLMVDTLGMPQALQGWVAPEIAWAQGEPVSDDPYADAAEINMPDGEYFIDVVLEGGTGRANITSPAKLTVIGGVAAAAIEWSSPNYDYMVVNGKTYLPVNPGGNSIFMIPVLAYDTPFSVVGDTTAMSEPHEIDYTLTFDSASIVPFDTSNQGSVGAAAPASESSNADAEAQQQETAVAGAGSQQETSAAGAGTQQGTSAAGAGSQEEASSSAAASAEQASNTQPTGESAEGGASLMPIIAGLIVIVGVLVASRVLRKPN